MVVVPAILSAYAGETPAIQSSAEAGLSFTVESLLTFVKDVRGSAGSYAADTEIAYLQKCVKVPNSAGSLHLNVRGGMLSH